MSVHKRTATIVVARQMRRYVPSEKVRVIRGKLAGRVVPVLESQNDWVRLAGMRQREVMSKGNIEPAEGFTEEELAQARRAAEKMQGLGSLI